VLLGPSEAAHPTRGRRFAPSRGSGHPAFMKVLQLMQDIELYISRWFRECVAPADAIEAGRQLAENSSPRLDLTTAIDFCLWHFCPDGRAPAAGSERLLLIAEALDSVQTSWASNFRSSALVSVGILAVLRRASRDTRDTFTLALAISALLRTVTLTDDRELLVALVGYLARYPISILDRPSARLLALLTAVVSTRLASKLASEALWHVEQVYPIREMSSKPAEHRYALQIVDPVSTGPWFQSAMFDVQKRVIVPIVKLDEFIFLHSRSSDLD
jgi:hypothetical protein